MSGTIAKQSSIVDRSPEIAFAANCGQVALLIKIIEGSVPILERLVWLGAGL